MDHSFGLGRACVQTFQWVIFLAALGFWPGRLQATSAVAAEQAGMALSERHQVAIREFAFRVQDDISSGNIQDLLDCVDMPGMADRVLGPSSAQTASRKQAISGIREGWRETLTAVHQSIGAEGSYVFLDHRTGRDVRLVFRLLTSRMGLNYHEWILGLRGKAGIVIEDIYIYSLGESLGETLRGQVEMLHMEQRARPAATGIFSRSRKGAAASPRLSGLGLLHDRLRAGDWAGVEKSWAALPENTRTRKGIFLCHVQALGELDERQYMGAVERHMSAYPKDDSTRLLRLDYHALRREWGAAQAAVEELNTRVGIDPYLIDMKSGLADLAGDPTLAVILAEQGLTDFPEYFDFYYRLIDIHLKQRQYQRVSQCLGCLFEVNELDFAVIEKAEEYSDYIKSGEYRQLKADILDLLRKTDPPRH